MIIFGSKTKHIHSVKSNILSCPSCEKKDTLLCSIYGRYFHVFWIPMFPFGKKGQVQCQHCKYAMEDKEMPVAIKEEYKALKKQTKTPTWHFAGLVLFVISFVISNTPYFALISHL